ncbi:maltose ABC transporter permease [Vibrio penaeicida]|uniref:maltose ABC transporter permease n=1 Tax=Vibrio penaeicida TaxID=104609 RepID=UPI001CC6F79F|nr:maltose ABC transporter permease [Vibrio penaeicida]
MEKKLQANVVRWVAISSYAILLFGWMFWFWLAINIGGFHMMVFAFFPLTLPFAAVLGLWSLVFGLPSWLGYVFI